MTVAEKIQKRTQMLVDVAMGRTPADIVIQNGQWVCVQSGEIIPQTDIAIKDDRIAFVGADAAHTIGAATQVIDADNRYLVPGLLDGHMHVESGMVTVTEFVRAVVPHGTTGMFVDPHEIANVFGLQGVRIMVSEAAQQPIHVWVQVPACVPSAPGLETPGAIITPADVTEALEWDGIIGLGEMMNFPGVWASDEKMHAEMAAAVAVGKTIGGHYAAPDLGLPFHAYAVGGAQDDHEGTNVADAVARIRQGMKVMLRHASAWDDIAPQISALTEKGLDPRHFLLCTDDSHAETLVYEGHMNRAVRQTIALGVDPIVAIQMATLNVAEHFGVARDIGQIAPGRYADILLVANLYDFRADVVIAKGQKLAENGQILADIPPYAYPEWAKNSVRLGKALTAADFKIEMDRQLAEVAVNVIGVVENEIPTQHLKMTMPPVDGEIKVDLERDILKIALVERHRGSGQVVVGLVHGFGLEGHCAVATTVVHDSHQMIVVGSDEAQMALAANYLGEVGGGQVVFKDGEIVGQVKLPIAGLMSDQRAAMVADQAASVLAGFERCGCELKNPNMPLSFLGLVVIPELRISDLGLVDVQKFEVISVIAEEK